MPHFSPSKKTIEAAVEKNELDNKGYTLRRFHKSAQGQKNLA